MKLKIIHLVLCFFIVTTLSAQKITFDDNTAFINNLAYVKVDKISSKNYIIRDVETNKRILKVKLIKLHHKTLNRYVHVPKVYLINMNTTLDVEVKINNRLELIHFLYSQKLILPNGTINQEFVLNAKRKKPYDALANVNL